MMFNTSYKTDKSKWTIYSNKSLKLEKIQQSINTILNWTYYNIISNKYPLFNILFTANNLIPLDKEYQLFVQDEPIINTYNKQLLIKEIQTLLYLSECSHGYENKTIIMIIIFHIIFSNFQFVIDNPKFCIVIKKKLNDFKLNDLNKIYKICDNYDLDKKFFNIWFETLENF